VDAFIAHLQDAVRERRAEVTPLPGAAA